MSWEPKKIKSSACWLGVHLNAVDGVSWFSSSRGSGRASVCVLGVYCVLADSVIIQVGGLQGMFVCCAGRRVVAATDRTTPAAANQHWPFRPIVVCSFALSHSQRMISVGEERRYLREPGATQTWLASGCRPSLSPLPCVQLLRPPCRASLHLRTT